MTPRRIAPCILLACFAAAADADADPTRRAALEWNQQALAAVRADRARPTVQARNLFHVSAAMYDAWAAYDPLAVGHLFRDKVAAPPEARSALQREAVSHAAHRVLSWKFGRSPGSTHTMTALDGQMRSLGITPTPGAPEPPADSPAGIGQRVAQAYIDLAGADGSLELRNYLEHPRHQPVNAVLNPLLDRTIEMRDPDRWQPLVVDGATQRFLTPQWGSVRAFSLPRSPDGRLQGFEGFEPPTIAGGRRDELRAQLIEVIRFTSRCDPDDPERIDISPAALGANSLGANDGRGRALNPATGAPYAPNLCFRADHIRALADYWADGPGSDTPPGHWNQIARAVSLDARQPRHFAGRGGALDPTEWDVKILFMVNAALHDAAVAAWDLKALRDTSRPISLIRWMAAQGQCSERSAPDYSENGLPLIEGLIERITPESAAPEGRHAALRGSEGRIAVLSWAGPPRPPTHAAGVTWILAERWMPFQAWDFTTPPFPGYFSGHSAFSRAAAEALARFTGSEFFPGGLFEAVIPAGAGLRIEAGPVEEVRLQWATYFDASDHSGLSRRCGGIHIAADDFDGRRLGALVGEAAFNRAADLFAGKPEP